MFCNVISVIQWGSCVLEHNNVKNVKSNATPQIHVFYYLLLAHGLITMEDDVRLVIYYI